MINVRYYMRYWVLFIVLMRGLGGYDFSSLPSFIVLHQGENRSDRSIARAGNGAQTSFSINRLSIIGANGANWTLNANNNTTHININGALSLDKQALVALLNHHTLAFNESSSTYINEGSALHVILNATTLSTAQGSEYGAKSKVKINKGAHIYIAKNAKADFQNMLYFINGGDISLEQGASLKVEASNGAIRFEHSLSSNGGNIQLQGDVYNVGYPTRVTQNTISSFVVRNAQVEVSKNFYNGGQTDNAVDTSGSVGGGYNVFDPSFGGGGSLVLQGSKMIVEGKFVSEQGGDKYQSGAIYNARHSEVNLYGSVLEVKGGFENKSGSTLTLGAYNGTMGQLKGNLTNTNGRVQVDMRGADIGDHKLITGTITGIQDSDIEVLGATDFATGSYLAGTLNVVKNQAAIDEFSQDLGANAAGILHILESATNVYTELNYMELSSMLSDVQSQQASSLMQPFITAGIIEKLAQNISDSASNVHIHTHGGGVLSQTLGSGFMGGVNIGVDIISKANAKAHIYGGYIYGSNTLRDDWTSISSESTSFYGGLAHRLTLSDTYKRNIYLFNTLYFASHTFSESGSLDGVGSGIKLESKYNAYLLSVGSNLGYGLKLKRGEIIPYVGVKYHSYMLGEAQSQAVISTNREASDSYHIYANLGIRGGVQKQSSEFFYHLGYAFLAYNSAKVMSLNMVANGAEQMNFYDYKNAHSIAFNLGTKYALSEKTFMFLGAEYIGYLPDTHVFGANLGLRYTF